MCKKAVCVSVSLILLLAASKSPAQAPDVEVLALNTVADLDLSGEIVYAINFGNNGNPRLGNVVFSQDQDHPNLSYDISAEGVITRWDGVYPGTGDIELDMLLGGIIWKNSGLGGRTTSVTIRDALIVGASYQLQLIFYTDHSRPMDIIVQGNTIVEAYNPYPAQGSVTGKGGSVVKYVFTAMETTLKVAAKSNPDVDASLLCGLILTKHWPPSPDFNVDWRVDIEDLLVLIEHWGQSDPSIDLAPPPAGDGIVDAQDLAALMAYWGQELDDPSLRAHWRFDEAEGYVAHDSAGENDAVVVGNATWVPDNGKVGGALALNGIDAFIPTGFALNPVNGPFSVFAWIKDGMPGQVIVSQAGNTDCLLADVLEGKLMTDLKCSLRLASPLCSDTVITDGNWHRVGFTWDGSSRMLYVDDVLVAQDAQDDLADSPGTLLIGAGKNLTPGTLWSGLVDDVRIYSRSVKP